MKLLKSWDEVTVFKWQQYSQLVANDKIESDEAVDAFMDSLICLMYEMTHMEVEHMTVYEYKSLVQSLNFLNEPPKEKISKRFVANGTTYEWQLHPGQIKRSLIKTAQAIEVKEFSKDFAGNIHKIVASCVTPKKKVGLFYFNTKKDHEEISNDMLHTPITNVLGYCVFFCNSLPKLINATMDYLLKNSPMEAKEKMQSIVDLWQGLDGYSMLNQFPNMKESN